MRSARRPGEPLAALGLVMGAWILARIILWQAPLPVEQALAMADAAPHSALAVATGAESAGAQRPGTAPAPPAPEAAPAGQAPVRRRQSFIDRTVMAAPPVEQSFASPPIRLDQAAALGTFALPPPPSPPPPLLAPQPARARTPLARWSGGGWLLLRGGAAGALAAVPGAGRYGGSQAGAVMSYSLGAGDRRPALYARTTAALEGTADRELALGAAARPFAAVPVRAQVELRIARDERRTRLQPAVIAVSELPRLDLPAGARAEAYFQAGYVAGDFATPFFGGDLRIDRPLAEIGGARLRAGAGAWGGAQKGAAALDIGPGVTLETELGGVPARLALDYRLRVAGGAEPRSGLALTLATGF